MYAVHEHQQLAKFQASARQMHSRVFRRRVVSDERCQCTFCAMQWAWPKQEFRARRRYSFNDQRERYKSLADAFPVGQDLYPQASYLRLNSPCSSRLLLLSSASWPPSSSRQLTTQVNSVHFLLTCFSILICITPY